MRRCHSCARGAFTLVELLVVIAIIGLLMAMALPVINMARARAIQHECGVRMLQLGQATFQYELARKQYPGYLNTLVRDDGKPFVHPETGQQQGVSWVIPLLNNMDQRNLYKEWTAVPGNGANPGSTIMRRLDAVICPANAPTEAGTQLCFVVNSGMQDQPAGGVAGGGQAGGQQNTANLPPPRDFAANGVFFDLYSDRPDPSKPASRRQTIMSSNYISRADGLSQTILLTENVDAGNYTGFTEQELGCIWAPGSVDTSSLPYIVNPAKDEHRINRGHDFGQAKNSNWQSYDYVRPSSFHSGGVNVVYCDTRLQFLNQDISYYVYSLLMSTNGKQVTQPGQTQPLKNYGLAFDPSWAPDGG